MAPPEPDDTGPHPVLRPRSVVTTSRSSPLSGSTPATCPRRTGGATRAHLLLVVLPWPTDRHLALDQLPWLPRRRTRRPSLCACEAAAQACRRHSYRPRTARRTTIPSPPGPIRAATTKPLTDHGDPSNPGAPNLAGPAAPTRSGIQRGADRPEAAAADSGRLSVRTPASHRSRGHRTPGQRTRGHRTSARPVGRTAVRMADSRCGQRDGRRGRCPDILDGHDHGGRRLGGATLARVVVSAALGNP
jgi:hypothetical protein